MRAGLRLVPGLLLALVSVTACAIAVPPVPESRAAAPGLAQANPAAHGTVKVNVTFYGGPDNDPPGSTDIAYPNGRHATAGGTGSYADPITLASDPRELPPGAMVYDAQLEKYFVMEDDCADCITEWGASHRPHVDLWTAAAGTGLLACEDDLTHSAPTPLEINPPGDRPVDLRPLYSAATNRCWPATTS